MLFIGWEVNYLLWKDWVNAIISHGTYLKSPQSLQYLLHNFFDVQVSWAYSILGLLLLLFFNILEVIRCGVSQKRTLFWSLIYIAFVPSFFITDTEHFIMALPLIMFLMYWLYQIKSKVKWIVFLFGILFYSFDSMDLLGRKLSTMVYDYGILGVGNLIFIILGIIIWDKSKLVENENSIRVEM
ncbi:MAG: hypothetical protein HYR91_09145 [Flavobacteriia bacterium]|nr:hypothetical protein [Flavobacteriia bacterium]